VPATEEATLLLEGLVKYELRGERWWKFVFGVGKPIFIGGAQQGRKDV
jgi:hypothetical protein